jgi:hypothetical protein
MRAFSGYSSKRDNLGHLNLYIDKVEYLYGAII